MKKSIEKPVLNVYIAEIPNEASLSPLYPAARNAEIDAVNNPSVKHEKYYAWKLLELAIEDTFSVDFSSIEFKKTSYGKWVSPQCEFSISHSENMVAVAVSTKNVGVDIQVIAPLKTENLPERIFTPAELEKYLNATEEEKKVIFTQIWAKKESIFKTLNLPRYFPADIDTSLYSTCTEIKRHSGNTYVISVAGECVAATKIIDNVNFNHKEGDYYVL